MLHLCGGELGQPIRRQAILWTDAALLSIEPSGTNFTEIRIEIKKKTFFHENAFENVVCETAAILSNGKWVNCNELNAKKLSLSS